MNSTTKRLSQDLRIITTVNDLTEVFQNISSIKIRSMRQQVLFAKLFFNELWAIYQQVRVDSRVSLRDVATKRKHLRIVFCSSSQMPSSVDQELIDDLLSDYDPVEHDIVVIGSHGVRLLENRNVQPTYSYEIPDITKSFTVDPLLHLVKDYLATTAFYNAYKSLTIQPATRFTFLVEVQPLSAEEQSLMAAGATDVITPANYIFEPSLDVTTVALEQIMLTTTVTQLLQESILSQVSYRFTTMTLAHERVDRQRKKTQLSFLSARRSERDEITRQIMNAARNI